LDCVLRSAVATLRRRQQTLPSRFALSDHALPKLFLSKTEYNKLWFVLRIFFLQEDVWIEYKFCCAAWCQTSLTFVAIMTSSSLQMLPYSTTAVGTGTHCEKSTDAICGGEGMGCTFEPFLEKEGILPPGGLGPAPSPTPASAKESGDSSRTPAQPEASNLRNIVAAAIAIPAVLLAVGAAVMYFIVLPWIRGSTNESNAGDMLNDSRLSVSRSHQASFEEENNYVENPNEIK
jgi:hypothetical protein